MLIPTTPQFQRARSALRTPIAILIGLPLLALMTGAGRGGATRRCRGELRGNRT